jgi:hypothetical protein
LSKLLVERELELAKYDKSIVDVELRRDVAEETDRGLIVVLDARARELSEFKALFKNVEVKYSATSSSNTLLRAELSVATEQKRAAEEAQKVAKES